MSSKPLSISGLLKNKEPVPKYPGITTNNRFLLLSEKYGKGARDRSSSAKRVRTESECTDRGEEGMSDESVFASMEKTEEQLKEAKAVIEQVRQDVEKIPDPGPLKAVLDGMVKWMGLTTAIQENTASVMLDEVAKNGGKAGGTSSAKAPPEVGKGKEGNSQNNGKNQAGVEHDSQDPRKKKFVQAVKEAEKATLVFNMDMGTVSVMNPATMNRKFSMALKAKAAEVDGNVNGEPKADTVVQLDDTLSMVKNMDFFGKATKKAKDKEYFTIPVKLSYKDKDTRMAAEQNLRKLCKVSCTTPYHSSLRDFMRKAMLEAKARYKDSFIQTRLDLDKMALKVSYRRDGIWYNDVDVLDLPDSVLDLSTKVSRVPTPNSSTQTEGMEVVEGESLQG
jgi:hypothetical protein